MNNNDCYQIKMAAFPELREVLKIKLLIIAFVSSILWLVNYAKKNNDPPEKGKITEI